ncbi:hypothetical protein HN018_14600 [Lichenicola cladoniae]|uniref:Uncharacterized protein n=1 Tax=Lichenicola cladoniae TaxID=1484109 RepID=A0A6M8HS11_9PROT|nr:hypothetical protein [Lichenicola cladoniae]NPD65892.1 hypothetical protein [Acetobacteraceae bacterium]QKE91110.1 hypothetical protein HN018_14600 [Lichenicola cladoniae]
MSGFILFGLVNQSFKVLQARFKGRDPGNRHFSGAAQPVLPTGRPIGSSSGMAVGGRRTGVD